MGFKGWCHQRRDWLGFALLRLTRPARVWLHRYRISEGETLHNGFSWSHSKSLRTWWFMFLLGKAPEKHKDTQWRFTLEIGPRFGLALRCLIVEGGDNWLRADWPDIRIRRQIFFPPIRMRETILRWRDKRASRGPS